MRATTPSASATSSRISIDVEGTLLDDLPDRIDRFHYDLVATTTFHADEAQALVHGRVPVVAMLVGPGYLELVHEIAGLPPGSRVGLVCASERGADNIAETLALSGTTGVEIIAATIDDERRLDRVDRTADLILLSREAIANGLDQRFSRSGASPPLVLRVRPGRPRAPARRVEHVVATVARRSPALPDRRAVAGRADPSASRGQSGPARLGGTWIASPFSATRSPASDLDAARRRGPGRSSRRGTPRSSAG